MTNPMRMASSARPEHGVQLISRSLRFPQIVAGYEGNGTEASVRTCSPQLISVRWISCIEMHRLGLRK